MSPTAVAYISVVLLVFLFLMRMPVAYVMALVGLLGFSYIASVGGGLNLLARDLWSLFSSYSLSVIPMFVFMGTIAFYSGISGRLLMLPINLWDTCVGGFVWLPSGPALALVLYVGRALLRQRLWVR